MGIMPFDAQPIPEVEEFIKKHYKGGTVLDFGCGAGRYAHCFPNEGYLGVDGHPGNISWAIAEHVGKSFKVADLEAWKPDKKFDYLFSSVVFDQLKFIPKGWAKKYILIEPTKYEKEFKILAKEPLQNISMMVAEDK